MRDRADGSKVKLSPSLFIFHSNSDGKSTQSNYADGSSLNTMLLYTLLDRCTLSRCLWSALSFLKADHIFLLNNNGTL